jgi:hypothetical protein
MPETVTLFSGEAFDLQTPDPHAIHLCDIALGLGNICRFGGQARFWWSVADHALLVRDLVVEHGYAELAFAALHHDSHEAYLGDIPTGLKRLLGRATFLETHEQERTLLV